MTTQAQFDAAFKAARAWIDQEAGLLRQHDTRR